VLCIWKADAQRGSAAALRAINYSPPLVLRSQTEHVQYTRSHPAVRCAMPLHTESARIGGIGRRRLDPRENLIALVCYLFVFVISFSSAVPHRVRVHLRSTPPHTLLVLSIFTIRSVLFAIAPVTHSTPTHHTGTASPLSSRRTPSTWSHPRRDLSSAYTDGFRAVPVYSLVHCSLLSEILLY